MVARMPEDHWISLDAGEEEGWVMTKPWGPPYEILLNADAQGGSIEAELVTPYGEPIEDFTRADSVPLTSDGTAQKADLEEWPVPLRTERRAVRRRLPQVVSDPSQALFLHLHAAGPGRRAGPAQSQRPLAGRDHSPLRSLGPRLQRAGAGVPPHPRHQSNPAGGREDFGKRMQESIRNKK